MRNLDFPHTAGASMRIVTGGDNKRQDPGQGNKLQATDPLRHGNNINATDYPFISIMGACNQRDLETNAPPPEPGSLIMCFPAMGDPSSLVAGFVTKDQNKSGASAGNFDLMGLKTVSESLTREVGKVVSNGFKSGSRNGAEIREPKNGPNWLHSLTKGLPTHAATWPLAGTALPSRQNIETAKQQFANILSPSMVSQMPGSFMGISDIFSGMSKNQKKQLKDSMPPDVYQAFESTATLMQGGDGGTFSTEGRVHPETFIANAVDLLSQVTNPADLEGVLHRMTYDTDLHGLDQLPEVEIDVEGAFGAFKQKIDSQGNITNEIPEAIQQLIEAFSSMLSSPSSAPGAGKGENMFGEAAATMTNMLGRIEPTIQKFRQDMLQELNTSLEAEKQKIIQKFGALEGGNPLSLIG